MNKIIRVLGIDVGSKKTGLAIGESLTKTAAPLRLLRKEAAQIKAQDLLPIVREWQISCIAIGLPLPADGKITPLIREIYRLGDELREQNLEVYFVDETLSSHSARAEFGKRKEYDSAAAAIIAETCLAENF